MSSKVIEMRGEIDELMGKCFDFNNEIETLKATLAQTRREVAELRTFVTNRLQGGSDFCNQSPSRWVR